MKKLLALLLALTLLLSVGITAFADTYEEGTTSIQEHTQTITVNAPALTWTLEIPADLEIEFGNTDLIEMGNLKISDVSWATLPANNFIYVTMHYRNQLSNSTDSSTIAYDLSCRHHVPNPNAPGDEMISSQTSPWGDTPPAYYQSSTHFRWSVMYIQISEHSWQAAVPGEKYTGTINYSSQYGPWQ